ncbi:MAG: hypothetical protein VB099_14125 [Candidatus Limiplasma sp.]|nr:hypothetical protein [Candidatus Limiplasma sp.]
MERLAKLEKPSDESWLRKAHTLIMARYAAVSLILAVIYAFLDMPYFYWQAFGTLFVLPILWSAYRLLGMRPVYSLDIVIVCYTFLAYTVGIVLRTYKVIPLYDKMMHLMAGMLSMMLAYPVFHLLKANNTLEKSDFPVAVVFFCVPPSCLRGTGRLVITS